MPKIHRPEVADGHKWCHQCSTAKPHTAFYRSSRKPDGLNYCCKACTAATRERGLELQRTVEAARQEVREFFARNPPKPYEPPVRPISAY